MSPPAIFILDEGTEPGFVPLLDIGPRWKELPHARSRARGFILTPGERLLTDVFRVDPAHRLKLDVMRGTEQVSADGLDVIVEIKLGAQTCELTRVHIGNEQHVFAPLTLETSLEPYAGREAQISVRCAPGFSSDPVGDWAALLTVVLAPSEMLNAAVARSQLTWRTENELSRFSDTYSSDFYRLRHRDGAEAEVSPADIGPVPEGPGPRPVTAEEVSPALETLLPHVGENAFAFAHRLLDVLIAQPPVDFAKRLQALGTGSGRRPRVLSLCAGEAGIESQLIESAGVETEITLVDINPLLLERAAARLPATARVTLWRGAAGSLRAGAGEFDVVCFVSGLHHVVELEDVLSRVRSWLAPDGELWLVGEQVGRNGNRLWPDAQRVADRLFGALPERLRFNHSTGRVDEGMPDADYASSCFEGVRSEDIPQAIARHFTPLAQDLRNCLLWRFVEVAYARNYDLTSAADVSVLRALAAAEFAFYANGGLGTELNAAYRPKVRRAAQTPGASS